MTWFTNENVGKMFDEFFAESTAPVLRQIVPKPQISDLKNWKNKKYKIRRPLKSSTRRLPSEISDQSVIVSICSPICQKFRTAPPIDDFMAPRILWFRNKFSDAGRARNFDQFWWFLKIDRSENESSTHIWYKISISLETPELQIYSGYVLCKIKV